VAFGLVGHKSEVANGCQPFQLTEVRSPSGTRGRKSQKVAHLVRLVAWAPTRQEAGSCLSSAEHFVPTRVRHRHRQNMGNLRTQRPW